MQPTPHARSRPRRGNASPVALVTGTRQSRALVSPSLVAILAVAFTACGSNAPGDAAAGGTNGGGAAPANGGTSGTLGRGGQAGTVGGADRAGSPGSAGGASGTASTGAGQSGGGSAGDMNPPGSGGTFGGLGGEGGQMAAAGTPGMAAAAGAASGGGGNTGGAGRAGAGGMTATTGGRGGNSGRGNSAGGAPGSAGSSGGGVFSPCQFHFGTIDSIAKANPSMIPQLDFFTPGWMGQKDTFDMTYVCTEANAGGELAGKVPVIVAYVAAFYAKRHFGRCDCNVNTCGTNNDLCHYGASDLQGNLSAIINTYKSYAQGFASCYGTTKPIVFEMEPDWYQYTISEQTQPLSEAQAGTILGQFVTAMKEILPNARFSMDISPWIGSNGADNGAEWYSHFDMSLFTFINTSGGSTQANTTKIRSSNEMTWAGVSKATGKPILADTGYGANGASAGPDPNWDNASNINARMADGVVSISQYNPAGNWGSTLASVRSQLSTPKFCP